jgi:hypothetical protein
VNPQLDEQPADISPRSPRDTLDSDWRNLLVSLAMIHRRVVSDRMPIRLSPYAHRHRRDLRDGIARLIFDITETAEIEEPDSGNTP